MITISLCMIVRNEEDVLARCLDCVKDIVDEIIIADTGSTDSTKQIAAQFTPHVYDFEWIDDFSAARNFAFSKATKDYTMWLDADDVLTGEDRKKLAELKQQLGPEVDVVMMKYCVAPQTDGSITLTYFRERLVKTSMDFRWHEPVHEYIMFHGKILDVDISVTHMKMKAGEPGRNIRIYDNVLKKGGTLSTRSMFYYARELSYTPRLDEAIKYYRMFLESSDGWFEDKISACNELSECCRMTGDEIGWISNLFSSFRYDKPRAEGCCGIGLYFLGLKNYRLAAFWFELALRLEKPSDSWGFIHHDFWDFVPAIQLCVCYDKLGNSQEAYRYHLMSAGIKPSHPSVLYNTKYFESLGYPAPESSEASAVAEAPGKISEPVSPAACDLNKIITPSVPKPFNLVRKAKASGNRLTLSMLVRNEQNHFLKELLAKHAEYIDSAVIIDDASTDSTLSICCDILRGIPLHIVHNPVHGFSNEILLRKQQWYETLKAEPDWVLCLDADELFEDSFTTEVRQLINQDAVDLYSFRLYDFWDETHYREDSYWCAHQFYRPFLIRPQQQFDYIWEESPQHCGRFPKNIYELPNALSALRLKHLGWSRPELRREKLERYMQFDPGAKYGIKEQYGSILDAAPNLVEWK